MLDTIRSQDIKNMSIGELNALAQEIRDRLLKVTSKNGGHLASNLGIVEITLAMHYVYDFPKDKVVWDVGHQSYVHKLLTGRNKDFDTLRQFHGLSGFPKRSESIFDDFGTGHASTSISAACGFALARDLRGEDHDVLAVIGDGAMTGGMAFEGLNQAGQMKTQLTVILNDNEMSISPNVGGMSQYLTRMRTDPGYRRFKEDMENFLKRIPTIGTKMAEAADRMKDSVKTMLVDGSFFEELGIKYYGPVNGHDIEELIHVFENVKSLDCPALVHCLTVKGKGYLPAETKPDKFHGVGAFDLTTGQVAKKSDLPSYTDVFADTLIDLAEKDQAIVGITAAMGSGTGMGKFAKRFPDRMIDVGIAEEHATTMSSALALSGLKPVFAVYSTFLQRGFDQLIHDCALQEAPVVLALDRAGLVGDDGPTHHGVFDLSYLRMIPNMTVMAPKDEPELQDMLYSALAYGSLTAVRYPRGKGPGHALQADYHFIEKGKGELLRRGRDGVIVAIGSMVMPALETAEGLQAQGISLSVINARFAKPLDEDLILGEATRTGCLITMEENVLAGGFGSGVLEMLNAHSLQVKVLRIGIGDHFVEHGNSDLLKAACGLDVASMTKRISAFYGKEQGDLEQ
jgi:1-deoxy-D-xylulose-5-phosphate synthase